MMIMIMVATVRCNNHPLLNRPSNRPIPYSPFLDYHHVMFSINIHVQMSSVRNPLSFHCTGGFKGIPILDCENPQ